MSTDTGEAERTGTRAGGEQASRIVRIGELGWPVLAAGLLLGVVLSTAPRTAWTPRPVRGGPPADAWQAPQGRADALLTDAQVRLGALAWSGDAVFGALLAAAVIGAVALAVHARSLRAAGLPATLAALLALVAASAPLLAWQATSPLGSGPLTLVSAILLWGATRHRLRWHITWLANAGTLAAAAALVALLVAALVILRWLPGAPPHLETVARLRGEIGALGLVLLLAGVLLRHPAVPPHGGIWVGLAALWAVSTPLPATSRAALLLPWVWWLIASGLAHMLAWRGGRARVWAVAGLAGWSALHAWQFPWGHARQQAALVGTWAEATAALVDARRPLVAESSARGRLVEAHLDGPRRAPDGPLIIDVAETYDAATAGARPLVLAEATRERLRWSGLALDDLPPTVGATLDEVLDAMPRGTVVVAGISRSAAAQLTPRQWRSLGRIGLRLADAVGAARAHAVVGVTRSRSATVESAGATGTRLAVLPGDPLGETGPRAPVDVRVEAGDSHVRLVLRDRPFIDARGLALVMFTLRGDLLGWRSGLSPAHVHGAPLGTAPTGAGVVVESLPCADIVARAILDVTALARPGALGIRLDRQGQADLRVWRPDGVPRAVLRPAALPAVPAKPRDPGRDPPRADQVALHAAPRSPAGVLLRGPVQRATISSTESGRACAAWPTMHMLDVDSGALDMPMHPRLDPYIGGGWHEIEPLGRGRFFRWMAGPHATLLLPLRARGAVRFILDAQPVASPRPGDEVRLAVNGRVLGARRLRGTRGLFEWTMPAGALRHGPNTVALQTTLALRPADTNTGGDARLLGLLVHGWSLRADTGTSGSAVPARP